MLLLHNDGITANLQRTQIVQRGLVAKVHSVHKIRCTIDDYPCGKLDLNIHFRHTNIIFGKISIDGVLHFDFYSNR